MDHYIRRRTKSPRPWRLGRHIPQNLYDAEETPIGVLWASEYDAAAVVCAMEVADRLKAVLAEYADSTWGCVPISRLRAILDGPA